MCSIVIDIYGHTVNYERFYQSLKPTGEIGTEVMSAYVELFNERQLKKNGDNNSPRKISFSPFFAVLFLSCYYPLALIEVFFLLNHFISLFLQSKLNVCPEKFDAKLVSREIVKMNKKFNFSNCDLVILKVPFCWLFILCSIDINFISIYSINIKTMFFHFQLEIPLVHNGHWTVTCINLLLKQINFLDSIQNSLKEKKAKMVKDMVTFLKSFIYSHVLFLFCKNIDGLFVAIYSGEQFSQGMH